MKTIKKILSAVTAGALTLSMAASGMAAGLSTVTAAGGSKAIELVNNMGMGWNLGNTFDCWGITWSDQTWTGWGNITPTQDQISAIKATGFDSIRIPITWYQHTDSSTFDIDDAYLEEIKKVVDYAYKEDMYVIINMHWDWVSDGSLWLNQGEAALPQFTTMWTEIANYFKDYDNHLVYEDMNEVTFEYNVLNKFNQTFVDTIRATGGNNADRLLVVAGKNTDLTDTCNSQFVVPEDDMIAVSIHYYTPPTFCVRKAEDNWGTNQTTWGTDSDKNELYNNFNKMKTTFADKGVPVVLGEYGVLTRDVDQKDKASIVSFLKTVANTALTTDGISAFLWDAGNAGDMQYFNRKSLEWFNTDVENVYRELANKGPSEGPSYTSKNRVTINFSDLEPDKNGFYLIDLTPYAGQDASLVQAIVKGTVTGGDGVGYGFGFDGFVNGADEATWTSEAGILQASDGTLVVDFDGKNGTDDADTYVLDLNYLQVQKWWEEPKDSGATAALDTITLIFDKEISVVDNGNEDPSEDPTETDEPTPTETDEPTPTETDEPTPTETDEPTPTETDEPAPTETEPVKEPEGLYVSLNGQYAGNGFWDPVYYVDNIPEKGTGSYSITVDYTGTTKDGDLILFLDSNINIYDYKTDPDAEGTTGLTDGNIKFEITSILVDGKEIEYTPAEPGTADDGKSLRLNIYNTWAKVKTIDPAFTVEEGITVNFDLTLGDGSEAPTEPDTETPQPVDGITYGDVNGDGVVDIMDVISLNKYLLGSSTLDDTAKTAADVDKSGEVDSTDSLNILKKVVELLDTLPV